MADPAFNFDPNTGPRVRFIHPDTIAALAAALAGGGSGGFAIDEIETGQDPVSTSAVEILPADADRIFADLKVMQSSVSPIFVGPDNTVTALDGHEVSPGQPINFHSPNYKGSLWAICAAGSARVSWMIGK